MVVAPPPSRGPSRDTGTEADVLRVSNLGVRLDHVPILEGGSFHVRRGTTLATVGLGSVVLPTRLAVLSGGEMQRVLIAWAVLDRPNVLLFDEPTATVDIGSEDMLYESLNRLEKATNITVFLSTHDLHLASE